MKKLSISGFYNWQKENGIKEFIFDSDNCDTETPGFFHISMRFPSLAVSAASKRIAFLNGRNSLCIDHIKEVDLYDECDSIGTVFDIICGGQGYDAASWRFIAD